MKRILSLVLMIALLLPIIGSATTTTRTYITDLSTFIQRYNAVMKEIEFKEIYGVDPSLDEKSLTISKGDVNDTIQFQLPNYSDGVLQLNLKGGTKNIVGIWMFLPTRGDTKAPQFLLEMFAGLTHGAGVAEAGKDVVEIMYELGMYKQGALADGKDVSLVVDGVKYGYYTMIFGDLPFMMGYAEAE